MQEKPSRTQAERRAATRAALIATARELFAERGYAGVGAPEIAHSAGVTRGAITHHFKDKTGLFHAVVTAEARAVSDMLAGLPASALREGVGIWFAAMRVPGRTRILLIDGPAVLGPAEMARIDAESGARQLGHGLTAALPARAPMDIAAIGEVLSAGFDRAALRIAEGAAPEPYLRAILALIEGLDA